MYSVLASLGWRYKVGCYSNFSSTKFGNRNTDEPKPVSQKKSSQNTGANINKHQCWSYLVSSVLRNRLCTIFLSSSAGATFSREAVLSSTRRSLLAGDHKDKTNSCMNDVQTQESRGSRCIFHCRKFGEFYRARCCSVSPKQEPSPKGYM